MLHEAWKAENAESNRQVSDEELVDHFQAGDESAFDELFNRYNLKLCNYLANLVNNADIGRELALDAFVKVYDQLPRGVTNFKAWLYRVGYNSAMDHWRHKKWFVPWEKCPEDSIYIPGPEEQVEKTELVKMAIGKIPEKYRAPIYLYYVEEMKQVEIASYLGIGERSVRRYIAKGMEELTLAYEYLVNHSNSSGRGGSSHE